MKVFNYWGKAASGQYSEANYSIGVDGILLEKTFYFKK